ncbi:MAG: tetratricopeptide repeat protein [Candidatus Scalindua sp.]
MKKTPKILVYSSILILAIYLFISITKDYTAHKYLSEYKDSLKDKKRDIKYQDRLLKRSLKYSSSNAETFFELGRLYADTSPIGKSREERIKSYTMSKEYFLEGLTRKPTDGRNRAVYAWYTGNNTNHAIEHFNMAINLGPTDLYQHMMYAKWCVIQIKRKIDITDTDGFIDKYRNEQKKVEALKAYDDQYINGVSISSFLRTAQMEWDKALLFWRSRTAYESLADLNLLSFELDRAIEYYKRADNKLMLTRCYIIKDDSNKAVHILGSIINKGGTPFWGNLTEIKKLLMVVTNNDPKNYRSFYWSGIMHTRLRKTEKAIGNFKTTVHLNPKHIDAHLNLAELYNQTGKVDLAIEEYETILEQAPNHKEATHLLSEAIRLKYKDSGLLIKP